MEKPYEIVIGLEVHVQLLTRSKLFCGCSTEFGAPPNTQTCPVCIGMPGVLPVMNRHAFELALKTACALNCEIAPFTKWDRKNYYYPDLPKNYQISQYDLPFSRNGYLEIRSPEAEGGRRRIGIIRVHLEEDAGKSMHDEKAGRADSRIDLNRAGTPLLEIVTRPDLRSPTEAKVFLQELKLLLNYLGVSDCNMQEGSLRVDANINIRVNTPDGPVPTPIVEVKNMNSFRAVERALAYEAERQYQEFLQTGKRLGEVPKQTRGWDDEAEVTRPQRTKEESSDYRYFPEPDLVPVVVTEAEIARIRASLGELPAALRERLERSYGLTAYDSDVLVSQGRPVVDYFEVLAQRCGEGKLAANWVQQEVLRYLNEKQVGIESFPIPAERLAELLAMIRERTLDTRRGREVFARMLTTGETATEALAALGFVDVSDEEIHALCRKLIAENPKTVADVKAGKIKAVGGLVGQAKKINPHVDPAKVREVCLRLIGELA
ncbi:MAG: Asp-tRNA(Asn)/Glu-tRNA(Gln) amidotransferase subunit GatB [Thermoguttaceae bacterium]|nr:Asp-tRNA(Asn)/Glu-tRNA(Gln) amidotransferase subunit GatB [Thermoguttaceae bacterium]MDW8078394.1 Asp-tRNA(Asn)/Glu-tRNA(Gln) amidotransferase subunit GatB [Thermoguttaceae bacterium]